MCEWSNFVLFSICVVVKINNIIIFLLYIMIGYFGFFVKLMIVFFEKMCIIKLSKNSCI